MIVHKVEVGKALQTNRHNKRINWSNGDNFHDDTHINHKKIFVGGLPSSLTEEELRSYFEKYGNITDAVIIYESVTRKPRGFGFVTFELEEAVENVLQNKFHVLNGKRVEVKKSIPKIVSNCSRTAYEDGYGTMMNNGGGFPHDVELGIDSVYRARPHGVYQNYLHRVYQSGLYPRPYNSFAQNPMTTVIYPWDCNAMIGVNPISSPHFTSIQQFGYTNRSVGAIVYDGTIYYY